MLVVDEIQYCTSRYSKKSAFASMGPEVETDPCTR